jgi:diguanylate cyclase (GGDEF)-like protein
MTMRAWIYVGAILCSGIILSMVAFIAGAPGSGSLMDFLLLVGLATTAQLFKSEAPSHQLYHPTLIFLFAGVLLLEPGWFVLMVIITHLVEWVKEAATKSQHLRAWYIQPFNISMHILVGYGARLLFLTLNPGPRVFDTLAAMVAATVAALMYALLNHLIVGQVLVLARGISWRESGILEVENISTDFVMLTMGYVVTILMERNHWLVFLAITPLYLIFRALAVPRLKQQVNTDPKTGLWNAKYFLKAMDNELSRADRFGRPLTVVMADLDFLRNINNAFGHLAGDAVLSDVAKILKENFREYDVVARFGGEEFAILLPETSPEEAYPKVETVRNAVEHNRFESPITHAEIKTTMSFGIAGNTYIGQTAKEIIHCADVAVYQAKVEGRNRTRLYSREDALMLGVFNREESEVDRPSLP